MLGCPRSSQPSTASAQMTVALDPASVVDLGKVVYVHSDNGQLAMI